MLQVPIQLELRGVCLPPTNRELQEPHKELAFEKKPKRTTWSWLWGRKRKPSQMP